MSSLCQCKSIVMIVIFLLKYLWSAKLCPKHIRQKLLPTGRRRGTRRRWGCIKSCLSLFPLSPSNGAEKYFYCLLYLLKEDLCSFFISLKFSRTVYIYLKLTVNNPHLWEAPSWFLRWVQSPQQKNVSLLAKTAPYQG